MAAGFFSLGRGGNSTANTSPTSNPEDPSPPATTTHTHRGGGDVGGSSSNNPTGGISPENLFFYRNEEITYKGFELWQTQQLMQDHQQTHTHRQTSTATAVAPNHHHNQDLYSAAVGLGVRPSSSRSSIEHHQQQQHHHHDITGGGRSSGSGGGGGYNSLTMFRASASGGGGGGGGGISCQDCGNQAKKDCVHMRCRTCCKSRGFQCATHVKSTWVPAAKRRERQQQLAALQQQQQQQNQGGAGSREHHASKRARESAAAAAAAAAAGGSSSSALVCSRLPVSITNLTGMEVGNFPSEISSPAVFRCVKVSSYEDGGDDQIAYQTAVNIGGHVFKGLLYDQGLDHPGGDSSSGTAGGGGSGSGSHHQHQQATPAPLNLISGGSMGLGGGGGGGSSPPVVAGGALNFLDPISLYNNPNAAHQLSSFMAGTQFFQNPPRP